jgi:hypothetical protein
MIKLVHYHTWAKTKVGGSYESARRVTLVRFGGRKWLQTVSIDASVNGGLRMIKAPLTDEKYMADLMLKGKPYPMSRALKTFRSMAKSHGCTKGAKKIIKEAAAQDA